MRANAHIANGMPDTDERPPFRGTFSQICADVEHCAEIGVDEVFIDTQFSPDGDNPGRYLEHLEQFAALNSTIMSTR